MSIANELITRGWTQGEYEDRGGRVCLTAASDCSVIGRVAVEGEEYTNDQAVEALRRRDALRLVLGKNIVEFNDDPATTFDDALRVAKEADELLGL